MSQYTREQKQGRIRALLEERAKCEKRELWDRVEQINAELGEVAQEAQLPSKRAEKRPGPSGARR